MRSQQTQSLRIYFDTEFCSLLPNAALISIGFVTSDGNQTFYAELADTFVPEECSEFCQENVLPLLEGGTTRKTLQEVRGELYTWLAAKGPATKLVCDSTRDIMQINALFPDGLPPNCECMVLSRFNRLRRTAVNFRGRLCRNHGLRHHHALDDAFLNRLIFG